MRILIFIVLLVTTTFACKQSSFEQREIISEQISIQIAGKFKFLTGVINYNSGFLITLDHKQVFYINDKKAKQIRLKTEGFDKVVLLKLENISLIQVDTQYYEFSLENNEIILKNEISPKKYQQFRKKEKYDELDNYEVSACCRGEWGGTVDFIHRKDSTIYSTESTCLVKHIHHNEKEYLFNYLMHGMGNTSIYQISSIDKLPKKALQESCFEYKYNLETNKYVDDDNSPLLKESFGNKILLDTYSLAFLDGLIYEDEIFVVHHPFQSNEIMYSKLLDGRLVPQLRFATNPENTITRSNSFFNDKDLHLNIIITAWNYKNLKELKTYENELHSFDLKSQKHTRYILKQNH